MWKTGGLTPAVRLSVCNYGLFSAGVARLPRIIHAQGKWDRHLACLF
jgi:hypothetical protein